MQLKFKGNKQNLWEAYSKADNIDYESGRVAYYKYQTLMNALAKKFGCTTEQATAVFVSTSPNNDYKNNLRSTISILHGWKNDIPEHKIKISTYNHCRARALTFLNGKDFLKSTKGPKISSFFKNIVNPEDETKPVTVDGHMVGAWAGKKILMKDAAVGQFDYKQIAQAVRELADNAGIWPCQFQAIIWFTWKRIHRAVYDQNLDLFGDHWGLDIDPTRIRPFN
jgi:hypothetical protein